MVALVAGVRTTQVLQIVFPSSEGLPGLVRHDRNASDTV